MADEKNLPVNEEDSEDYVDVYTLTDEEGNECEFIVLAEADIDGAHYLALDPQDKKEDDEEGFVVLKEVVDEKGEKTFETVDDDEEFDKVADFFEDLLVSEYDYDSEEQ